ncbi:hypothetical protein ABZW02_25505 [Streptomyces sp. NPDC005180]|uniref:hypothetical protein n=1 Tax=Streptomyces sp. NPDC005180 TaxID=3156868 RepID=UPI0033AEC032
MDNPLPRRIPGSSGRQPNAEVPSRPPWNAFATASATYGQPSAALVERANRGWRNLGARHSRIAGDVSGADGPNRLRWEAPAIQPSTVLLGRARRGWERFVRTAEEAPGE